MRVMQVPFCYFPDPPGGTEVYVRGLVRELGRLGIDACVAAPGRTAAQYEFDGVPVHRYLDLSFTASAAAFAEVLDRVRPSIVHFHGFNGAVNSACATGARSRGIPVVWTYHTPIFSCGRGTMMRFGDTPCDGKFIARRCTACAAERLSGSRLAGLILGSVPTAVSAFMRRTIPGAIGTALGLRSALIAKNEEFRRAMALADRVVAVCEWVRNVLVVNGVEEGRILLSRQGVMQEMAPIREQPNRGSTNPLRLAYFGRIDPSKGIDLVIDAVRALPEAALRLDVFGVLQPGLGQEGYMQTLRNRASGDPRIQFLSPVAPEETPATMSPYDFVVVPSRGLETGPLVVLEAFAAGVPVLGSRLGGLEEIVDDGVDGILVGVDSLVEWIVVLSGLLSSRARAANLRANVRYPRTAADVAREMVQLYHDVVTKNEVPIGSVLH